MPISTLSIFVLAGTSLHIRRELSSRLVHRPCPMTGLSLLGHVEIVPQRHPRTAGRDLEIGFQQMLG